MEAKEIKHKLTPAEKQKRYRERIKNDPQKYEIQKKKDLERVKKRLKPKKVAEMTESEKELQRKIWRENKKKQKEKKKQVEETNKTTNRKQRNKTVLRKRIIRNHEIIRRSNERMIKLKKVNNTLRKRYERLHKNTTKQIKNLEETILKMKAREELLELALRETYKKCETKIEKRVLKNLTKQESVQTKKGVGYVTKLLGLRKIRVKPLKAKKTKCPIITKEIHQFFLRDDISRCTAGKKECKTFKKDRQQKRYLLDTLYNLYQTYKQEGGKYSFSTFYKYKPFFILSPSVSDRETCMCLKHSNMDMLFNALKKNKLLLSKSLSDFICSLVCDKKSRECMYGECEKCKGQAVKYNTESNETNKILTWQRWERVNHEYQKFENGTTKTVLTKKMVKQTKKGNFEILKTEFETNLVEYKKHSFNVFHQQRKYQEIINNLGQNEALILVDFSENYSCKMGEEVQAMHFGASKSQITLHCGMVYWKDVAQSFCTVSNNNSHDPSAIWAHLLPVIKLIKDKTPQVDTLHFYSDGPSSQYRQKKNFYLLSLFQKKLGLKFCTWSFFESGHGKGVADGIGGSVKRCLDRQVSYGYDVTDAIEAHETLTKRMKLVKCIYVTDKDINNVQKLIPTLLPVPGTLKIHQIICQNSLETNEIHYRHFSCFCVKQQVCECHSPKCHKFPITQQKMTLLNCQTAIQTPEQTNKNCDAHDQIITEYVVVHDPPQPQHKGAEKKQLPMIQDDTHEKYNADLFDTVLMIEDVLNKKEISAIQNLITTPSSSVTPTVTNNTPNKAITVAEIHNEPQTQRKTIEKVETSYKKVMHNEELDTIQCYNAADETVLSFNKNKISEKQERKSSVVNKENDKLKPICIDITLKKCASTDSSRKRKLNSEILTETKKQNFGFQKKSLRTIVSRNILQCSKCNSHMHFTTNMIRCISCKRRYCLKCCEGLLAIDFICDICLTVDEA